MKADEVKRTFFEYLRSKGLRNTRQRERILDLFLRPGKHVTIEELYDELRKTDPDIGFATVHRNLKLMSECGLANEIKVGNRKTVFEPSHPREHHDHMICLKCGQFIEVFDKRIEKLQDGLAEANGFSPLRHKLEIYGLCKDCR